MRFAPAALALAMVISARGLSGQSVTPLPAGTRIRVTTGSLHRKVGSVLALTPDSLRILPEAGADEAVSIALPEITELDVSTGRHRHRLRGAGWGLVIGAVTGATLASATYDCESHCWFSRGDVAAMGATMVGLAGAGVGALIGGLHRSEDWTPVMSPASVRVGALPLPSRRLGLAVAVSF